MWENEKQTWKRCDGERRHFLSVKIDWNVCRNFFLINLIRVQWNQKFLLIFCNLRISFHQKKKLVIFNSQNNRNFPSYQRSTSRKTKLWIREDKKEGKEKKNVNRFLKQQCVLVFFADSFAGALLIRMRATATRQHQRKNADSLIIIFKLLFSFHFFLFILFCWDKIIERKEKRARDVNLMFFFFLLILRSPGDLFFVISFLCERERRCLRLNDHWDEVRKVSFVVSRRFKLRKKFIIQFANERKIKKEKKVGWGQKNVSLTRLAGEILLAVIPRLLKTLKARETIVYHTPTLCSPDQQTRYCSNILWSWKIFSFGSFKIQSFVSDAFLIRQFFFYVCY